MRRFLLMALAFSIVFGVYNTSYANQDSVGKDEYAEEFASYGGTFIILRRSSSETATVIT